MIVEVVGYDEVTVVVQNRLAVLRHIDFVPGVVLAWLLHGGKENGIVLPLGAEKVVPLLHKKHGGLGAGVGLEHVAMQPHHRQNAAALCDEVTDVFVAAVYWFLRIVLLLWDRFGN